MSVFGFCASLVLWTSLMDESDALRRSILVPNYVNAHAPIA